MRQTQQQQPQQPPAVRRLHTHTPTRAPTHKDEQQQTTGAAATAATAAVASNGAPAAAAAPTRSTLSSASRLILPDSPAGRLVLGGGMPMPMDTGGVEGAPGFGGMGMGMGMGMGGPMSPADGQWERPLDPRMLDCILVRHGESEGNIGSYTHARTHARAGRQDDSGRPAQGSAAQRPSLHRVPLLCVCSCG